MTYALAIRETTQDELFWRERIFRKQRQWIECSQIGDLYEP